MRERVEALLLEAARKALTEHDAERARALDRVSVVPTKTPEHGDFATPVALGEAKRLGISPRDLAERIVASVEDPERLIERLEIAGPGFINVFMARSQWHDILRRALQEDMQYGLSDAGAGRNVQIEFVSANPTGPITIGHGRNAVLGDAIARLLEATGHKVTREYYFNDAGNQMRVLGESLQTRYQQVLAGAPPDERLPEGFYGGLYLRDTAEKLLREHGRDLDWSLDQFRLAAQHDVFAMIERTLEQLKIRFDVRFNERSLYETHQVEQALADLRATGAVYEQDGAVWLRASDIGLERDRVLMKSSGEPTYLLPDIAYHRDKFKRGFDRIIDVLGPDHIDQFPYVKAAMTKLGFDGERMEVAIYQWVTVIRDGKPVKMSKRLGNYVTVDEVVEEVGTDVFRFFMVERRSTSALEFDVDLAKERSDRNPVYKIQYAHARLCSIGRKAAETGTPELAALDPNPSAQVLSRLSTPAELELVKIIGRYPDVVAHAAEAREPQEIARYVLELANAFNAYVTDGKRHRVLSDDLELSCARLYLVRAVRITLRNGLNLLGITAPERM